ncbi:F18 fimbrial protein FedE [Escherichia sp. E4930]|uniref:F18 fimbrial protein FedE n=1 Tax=Escherichia sp. E4930 TaxID=2044468 RepID=UPI001101A6B9|nr:F18 fimbrial protein FedE [Escherichia sp. E4930]TGB71789.1 F18 fimbrial protein FedE [Escherichia sp. E4930]
MRLTKAALAALMMVVAGSGQAATTATATLTINVTFTQPSCDIKVPASYNLGLLTPGETKNHGDLTITWECQGNTPMETALTAEILAGSAENDNKVVRLKAGNGNSSNGNSRAALSLRDKAAGTLIKMTGPSGGGYFCRNSKDVTGIRTCTLTPVTEVSSQGTSGALGPAFATLRFEVGYP